MNRGSTEIQEEREQERKSERGSMTVVESCQLGFGLTDRQTDGRAEGQRLVGRPAVVLEVESILKLRLPAVRYILCMYL